MPTFSSKFNIGDTIHYKVLHTRNKKCDACQSYIFDKYEEEEISIIVKAIEFNKDGIFYIDFNNIYYEEVDIY